MNIYVANLSFNITDDDLRELFEAYGNVSSAKVIMDRMTGRSRGFGFVEMDNDTEAQKAIDELNQGEFDGKVISVSVARPRTDRPAGGGGNRFSKGGGGGGFNKGPRNYGGGGGGNRY
jgi:RNA recognition motif-containing protein